MTAPNINLPVSGEWASSFDIPVQQVAEPPRPSEPIAPKPMAIVVPFIEREREQVLRLLGWVLKLSGEPLRRTLYLVPFKGLKIDDVLEAARAAFETVEMIRDHEGAVSDWKKGDKVRDAAGPNSLFRQAAWHFLLSKPDAGRALGPWLWLEPDCVPLVARWDETIEAAYRAGGKPFLGARMKFSDGSEYLNGVAVYPRDAVNRAPTLVTRATWTQFPDLEIAFDVAGGAEVLRQAVVTDLIAFDQREGAVLFHGDRDSALLSKLSSGQNKPRCDSAIRKLKGKGSEKNGERKSKSAAATKSAAGQPKSESEPEPGPVSGNGAAHVPTVEPLPDFSPTVGDEIRYHINRLEALATNANRKTRILKGLRKTTLLPRIAR